MFRFVQAQIKLRQEKPDLTIEEDLEMLHLFGFQRELKRKMILLNRKLKQSSGTSALQLAKQSSSKVKKRVRFELESCKRFFAPVSF